MHKQKRGPKKPKTNLVFLGCNYSNKKVKGHFDSLKKAWEKSHPISVVIIDDNLKGKGAADLWVKIKEAIKTSALSIFDVSGFKPNVILELGYALAVKDEKAVVISFDERKKRKGKDTQDQKWLLSDIGQLKQIRYKTMKQLDKELEQHLHTVPSVKRFKDFEETVKKETKIPEEYCFVALNFLRKLINERAGFLPDTQLQQLARGKKVHVPRLREFLKQHKLAKRRTNGPWYLVEEE